MRLSSHRSSSTFNIGRLEAARVNPALSRRVASSRPKRCGIETIKGADIFESSTDVTVCNPTSFQQKSRSNNRVSKMELYASLFVFPADGRATDADCRAG